MNVLIRLYQYINILSLDVVAGSLIGALFFAEIFHAPVYSLVLAALAVTVWIIYTIDHLRDARAIKEPASTDRHRFHQRHFEILSALVLLMVAVDVVLAFFLPAAVLHAGLTLGVIVVLYLSFQRHLRFMKEIFVACLYTAGVLLPSVSTVSELVSPEHGLLVCKFVITALMNLLLFSFFDLQADRRQEQYSFGTSFGARSTSFGIVFLGLLNLSSGIWLWRFDPALAAIFISMNALLLGILAFRRNLVQGNYYRMLGDAAFFIPVVYLL